MNNKGFAITGILYSLLVLFLLLLATTLNIMTSNSKYYKKSIESLNKTFDIAKSTHHIVSSNNPRISNYVVKYTGKYIFENETGTKCIVYLKKGVTIDINNITFTSSECNEDGFQINNLKLKEYYLFGGYLYET